MTARASSPGPILARQDGVAMLTVLMLTIILTVIGIAAITTTTIDIKMAGGERLRESSVNAGESCISSSIQVIQQVLANGSMPSALTQAGANPALTNATDPSSPKKIPTANPLVSEILGQSDENTDTADPSLSTAAPNAVLSIPSTASPLYRVNIDIDRLYAKQKSGGSASSAAGYQGTGSAAAIEILYRIDCYARDASVGGTTASRISGVYACVATGESCQRKI